MNSFHLGDTGTSKNTRASYGNELKRESEDNEVHDLILSLSMPKCHTRDLLSDCFEEKCIPVLRAFSRL